MSLFDPLWKRTDYTFNQEKDEKNIKRAIESLDKITDNKKLFEVVVHAPILKVAEAAAEKITDETMLFAIASGNYGRNANGYDIEIRKTAARGINDLTLLERLENDPEKRVAEAARLYRHTVWEKSMREKYQNRTVEELRDLEEQATDQDENTLIRQIMHEKNMLILGPIADCHIGTWSREKGLTNSYAGTYKTDATLYCFTCRKQTQHRVAYRVFNIGGERKTETINVECCVCKNTIIYGGPDSFSYKIMMHHYK